MATTSQVQAALGDVASLLDHTDAMPAFEDMSDEICQALDELRAERGRVDAAQVPADTDITVLQSRTDRVRELLDQIDLERRSLP